MIQQPPVPFDRNQELWRLLAAYRACEGFTQEACFLGTALGFEV